MENLRQFALPDDLAAWFPWTWCLCGQTGTSSHCSVPKLQSCHLFLDVLIEMTPATHKELAVLGTTPMPFLLCLIYVSFPEFPIIRTMTVLYGFYIRQRGPAEIHRINTLEHVAGLLWAGVFALPKCWGVFGLMAWNIGSLQVGHKLHDLSYDEMANACWGLHLGPAVACLDLWVWLV